MQSLDNLPVSVLMVESFDYLFFNKMITGCFISAGMRVALIIKYRSILQLSVVKLELHAYRYSNYGPPAWPGYFTI